VFAAEALRLARNGREWHPLIAFCAWVDTFLLMDEDSVDDPRLPDDRLRDRPEGDDEREGARHLAPACTSRATPQGRRVV
jgi:hypothetical protein